MNPILTSPVRASLIIPLLFLFINVKAQNCSVNAGLDKTICVTQQPLILSGTAGSPQSAPAFIQWEKLSGPAATITTSNAVTTSVTGLTPGNYVFQLSNKCIDGLLAKDIVAITVLPEPPTALAGPDMNLCLNGPISLSANAVSAPFTGTWTVSPAGGTFSPNANAANAVYTGPEVAGIKTFTWTISNGSCAKSANMVVTTAQAVSSVSAGPDTTWECKGKCSVLNGSYQGFSPIQNGLWTVVSGPNTPTFAYPRNNITKVCNLVPGDYTFRWTVSGACVNDSDDVVLHVINTLNPPASLGDQVYINFCKSSGVSSEVLTGAPLSPGETAVWTQISGATTATFSPDNHGSTVTVNNLTGEFPYKFSYAHTSADGCTIVTMYSLYRSQPVTGLSEPADKELPCDVTATSFALSFNELNGISNGLTTKGTFVSGPISTGTITHVASSVIGTIRTDTWTVQGLVAPGTYVYSMEYKNVCGTTYRDIAITVSRTPGIVNAGSDIILPCNELVVNPIGSVNAPGIYNWTQVSGPNNAILTGENALIPGMTGLTEGVYVIRLNNSGGRACPAKTDDVKIIVTRSAPLLAVAGPDTLICAGSYRLTANTPLPTETGSWTVIPAPGIQFYPNANTPNATVTGLAVNTTYTFTWTVSNACGSISDTQHITTSNSFSPPVPNAGADICVGTGTTSVNLYGNNANGASILWTALTPGSSISPVDVVSTAAAFTESGNYEFEYALSTEGCGTLRDTVMVTINANTTIDAGADINVCTATLPWSVVLNATMANSAVGFESSWRQLSGPSTAFITAPLNPSSRVGATQAGIYEFEYSVRSGGNCPDMTDTVTVRISLQPSEAIAGPDRSICSALPGTVVILAATAPVVGNGYWQVTSGPLGSPAPLFSNQNAATSTISNLTQGIYQLRWTVSNESGCSAHTDDMVLNINAAANAGTDFSRCNVNSTSLTANPNTNGTWSIVSGPSGASITANSGNTAIVNGLLATGPAGVYKFSYSLQAVGTCPATTDEVILTNYPAPSDAHAGTDKALCSGETMATLTGNNPASGTGSWLLESGPNVPSPLASNNSFTDTTINNLIAGIYIYQYQVNTNPACMASIDRVQVVKEVIANAQADMRLCNVSSVNLSGNMPALSEGTWSYVSGPLPSPGPVFSNAHNPATSVTGLIAGTYIFRWTIAGTSLCASTSDDVQVIIDPAAPPVNAGSNRVFCQGSTAPFHLGPAAIAGVTYTWSPVLLLSNSNVAQPMFQGVNNAGNYIYTLRAGVGACESFSSVNVKVNPSPFVNIGIAEGTCAATFIASAPGSGVNSPLYSWNFGENAMPSSATGAGPYTVMFTSSGTKSVVLNINSADGCNSSTSISYAPVCALPVKLTSFDAVWKNDHTDLTWEIEDAINFSHFELERSYNGIDFNSINSTNYIANVKRYGYPDRTVNSLSNDEVFYRLKMIDLDNSFTYSPIKTIRFQHSGGISIWPNPFNDRIEIQYTSPYLSEKIMLKMYSASGQLVVTKEAGVNQGNNLIEMSNLGNLSSGMYTLQFISKGTIITNHKLIKRF